MYQSQCWGVLPIDGTMRGHIPRRLHVLHVTMPSFPSYGSAVSVGGGVGRLQLLDVCPTWPHLRHVSVLLMMGANQKQMRISPP